MNAGSPGDATFMVYCFLWHLSLKQLQRKKETRNGRRDGEKAKWTGKQEEPEQGDRHGAEQCGMERSRDAPRRKPYSCYSMWAS